MAVKKTPAKAATAPALAPATGMSANYEALLRGLNLSNRNYDHLRRVIAFAYNGKCITAAERDALVCFVAALFGYLTVKVLDDIKALDATYEKEYGEYKRMKESG